MDFVRQYERTCFFGFLSKNRHVSDIIRKQIIQLLMEIEM